MNLDHWLTRSCLTLLGVFVNGLPFLHRFSIIQIVAFTYVLHVSACT